jgi:outer membrane lipoprotein-sorting protein
MVALLSGCASAPRPLPPHRLDVAMETLSSPVSLSVHSEKGGLSGSGHLLYRRPGSFRLVLLTPFGTTAFDFCAVDDQITFLLPAKGIAFSGTVDELPRKAGFDGWRLLKWVLAGDPLARQGGAATMERQESALGAVTVVYGADGLLAEKRTAAGDRISYSEFGVVAEMALPFRLEIVDRQGGRATVELEEPELNSVLDEGAFNPSLVGMTILPLSELKME